MYSIYRQLKKWNGDNFCINWTLNTSGWYKKDNKPLNHPYESKFKTEILFIFKFNFRQILIHFVQDVIEW